MPPLRLLSGGGAQLSQASVQLFRIVYSGLWYLVLPFALLRLFWRSRGDRDYAERWRERLGFYGSVRSAKPAIWLHAVSVGEFTAALPLLKRLQGEYPSHSLLITTTTPTASRRVREQFGADVEHVYLPFDCGFAVRAFFTHFAPVVAVILETELWPNLFRGCKRRRIPLLLVNARLSDRSFKRHQKIRALTLPTLRHASLIAAQSSADAERFTALGCDPDRVRVIGNLKFDQELISTVEAVLPAQFAAKRVVVLASSHETEESLVLHACKACQKEHPDLVLVIAPRHPERFDVVEQICLHDGWRVGRRSRWQESGRDPIDVFILDTLGELRSVFPASLVAIVGGSFVPIGGHNLLEPAAAGIPVIHGPFMHNAAAIAEGLCNAGGAVCVGQPEALAEILDILLTDATKRTEMGEKARAFVLSHQGGTRQIVELVREYLDAAQADR